MFETIERNICSTGRNDPVLQIRMGIAALAGDDRTHWPTGAKSELLGELLDVAERLEAEILRLTGDWDHDRGWEIDGSLSPRAWLTQNTPLAGSEAHRLVHNARIVADHNVVATDLADGEITAHHVAAMGRVMSNERSHLLAEHAPVLVEQARTLSVTDFTTVMRRWAVLADDQLARDEFAAKWERRHLHTSVGFDGWVTGDFLLDPVAGAALIGALDHEAPPDPGNAPDGPRTLSQRRADALVDIVNQYVGGGATGGNPPNVNVTIDIGTMLDQTPPPSESRCDIDSIGPVAQMVLDQLGCDARFARFIMAGPSQILDMGRAVRLPTKAQRRAVTVRDRNCQFRNCGRKPQWCDIHHIDGWVESLGETNLDNLILLCRRHHTLVHIGRWTITRNADGEFDFIHPARGP